MILKSYSLNIADITNYSIFLLYGKNHGLKEEIIDKYFVKNFQGDISKYDETDFTKNFDTIFSEILNKSLFEDEKLIIISRTTDKIIKIIDQLSSKKLDNVKFILKSGNLDKKSKLRNIFEKSKNFATIAFYEDKEIDLYNIILKFLNENKIKLSRESINLLVGRASGDRQNLKSELDKIINYASSNKELEYETIKKLTNLSENYNVGELADQFLSKNSRKISKILNENNYSDEDCILIIRTILIKSKRLLEIIEKNIKLKNIDFVINNIKPPIFWKDKEIVKKQVKAWDLEDLKSKVYEINEVEALIKNNSKNSLNILSDFIINY